MRTLTKFTTAVVKVVKSVPKGKVVSYGQVALYVGIPRAAIQVGTTLRNLEFVADLPWWRVINNAGYISIKGNIEHDAAMQKALLEEDGVVVSDKFDLDINKYRWRPSEAEVARFQVLC